MRGVMWLRALSIIGVGLVLTIPAYPHQWVNCELMPDQYPLGVDYPYEESPLVRIVPRTNDDGETWAYSIFVPKEIKGEPLSEAEIVFRTEGQKLPDMYIPLDMRRKLSGNRVREAPEGELIGFVVINELKFDVVYFRAAYGCLGIGQTVYPHNKSSKDQQPQASAADSINGPP